MHPREEASPETTQLLQELQRDWTRMGEEDPILWTIGNSEIDLDQYFESGHIDIAHVLSRASACGFEVARGKALDFGCGIGRLTKALGRIYAEVHGLDLSPSMIARAKAANANLDQCRFHVHSKNHLSLFDTDYFDFIVAINVLQYIPPLLAQGYVREFIRILKPGGLVYLNLVQAAFPRPLIPVVMLNLYRRWKYKKTPLSFRAHKFHVSEKAARAIIAEGGAKVLHMESGRTPTWWTEYRVFATKE